MPGRVWRQPARPLRVCKARLRPLWGTLAVALKPMFEEQARERMKLDNPSKANLPDSQKGQSRDQAATPKSSARPTRIVPECCARIPPADLPALALAILAALREAEQATPFTAPCPTEAADAPPWQGTVTGK